MRILTAVVMLGGLMSASASAQGPKATPDRAVADALRDVHDRGAELYNAGDAAAGYRMYQGGLIVARDLLGHRPDVQKLIADGLSDAERQPSVARRAFVLHELIEKVRVELRPRKSGEPLTVPPREVPPTKGGTKGNAKPSAAVGEVRGGVVGRVVWQGKPVAGVDVLFVTLGRTPPRVYETVTGAEGVYAAPAVTPGRYVVLIAPGQKAEVKKLPERYATATTSPLVIDVKGGGEKLDFVLQ